MKYIIKADTSTWPKLEFVNGFLAPYFPMERCVGEIELQFFYNGKNKVYKNNYTYIPLFISELDEFLNKVNSDTIECWYLGFAPFASGLMEKGSLLISQSTTNKKTFTAKIYDSIPQEELELIKKQLAQDCARYGKLEFDDSRDGKIVDLDDLLKS